MDSDDELCVGQVVALRADVTRVGPIIATLPSVDGRPRVRVFHSGETIRDYFADQLQAVPTEAPDVLERALRDEAWVDPMTLHAGLVATRLTN